MKWPFNRPKEADRFVLGPPENAPPEQVLDYASLCALGWISNNYGVDGTLITKVMDAYKQKWSGK